MVYLIIGGSGSGKSAYAEQLMERFTGVTEKYYLATMQIFDEEGEKRKMKHKAARQGKGFLTIEQPRDIGGADQARQRGIAGMYVQPCGKRDVSRGWHSARRTGERKDPVGNARAAGGGIPACHRDQ